MKIYKVIHKVVFAVIVLTLSGCASWFSPSPTVNLNFNIIGSVNDGNTLSVLVVPMSKKKFLETNYASALEMMGDSISHLISLNPEDLNDGGKSVDIPAQIGQGYAVFILFTHMSEKTQWKYYLDNAFGKSYEFQLTNNSISNFEEE